MNTKIKSAILLFLIFTLLIPAASSSEEGPAIRGKYIYDESGALSIGTNLGLSALLWKQNVKNGYQTVYVFPTAILDDRQMTKWFNDHGVGDPQAETGLAIFFMPDSSVYGMVGRGHDRIAAPFLSVFAARSLVDYEKDPSSALLNLTITIGKQLDQPTTYQKAVNTGKFIWKNIDLIILWAIAIWFILLLLQQWDGFQWSDLTWPTIILVVALVFIGIATLGTQDGGDKPTTAKEFGMITSVDKHSRDFTRTHCSGSGKSRTCWTSWHTEYTNDAEILSYDFRQYAYRFSTEDHKGAWNHAQGDLLGMEIYIPDNRAYSVEYPVNDFSGGKTSDYGAWLRQK